MVSRRLLPPFPSNDNVKKMGKNGSSLFLVRRRAAAETFAGNPEIPRIKNAIWKSNSAVFFILFFFL